MSLSEKMEYFYIKRIKKWIECPVCHEKLFFNNRKKAWCCDDCHYSLSEKEFLDDYVFWFCDCCETYLNVQQGFNRKGSSWTCKICGFENDLSYENIHGVCRDCDCRLDDPDASLCESCRTKRLKTAQIVLRETADTLQTISNVINHNDENNN